MRLILGAVGIVAIAVGFVAGIMLAIYATAYFVRAFG